MGRFVIAAFKPKLGMVQQLDVVVEKHWRVLRAQRAGGIARERDQSDLQAP